MTLPRGGASRWDDHLPVGAALGAQAGIAEVSSVIREDGFGHVHRTGLSPGRVAKPGGALYTESP